MDKLALVLALAVVGLGVATRFLAWMRAGDGGDAESAEPTIAEPMRAGMRGFVGRQLRGAAIWSGVLAVCVFLGHRFVSPAAYDGTSVSASSLAGWAAATLGLGALGAIVVVRLTAFLVLPIEEANARAARPTRPTTDALVTSLRGGASGALLATGLAVLLLAAAFVAARYVDRAVAITRIPLRLAPYALGAVIVALVVRTTGAVFARGAAMGEVELRHVDETIPSDDLRNPALVTSLVARRVGDRLGRSAEAFAQVAIEGIATMILAGGFVDANRAALARLMIDPTAVVLFPLVVRAFALIAAVAGVMGVKTDGEEDPMDALDRGYWVTAALVALALFATAYWTFHALAIWFSVAGLLGVLGGHAFVLLARYHTDARYRPMKEVAEGSSSAANVVVRAFSVGLGASAIPVVVLALVMFGAYRCGEASGLSHAGILATAIATSGMLAAATYFHAIEHLGPFSGGDDGERLTLVARNAGVLARGLTIGVVTVIALVGLRAYLYVIMVQRAALTGDHMPLDLDLGHGPLLLCALAGGMLATSFLSLCLKSVRHVAESVVTEAKTELADLPRIEGRVSFPIDHRPDYRTCVDVVAADAHLHSFAPLLIAIALPLLVGFFLHRAGAIGAEAVGVFCVSAVIVSFLLSLTLGTASTVTRGTEGDDATAPFRELAVPVLSTFTLAIMTIAVVLAPLFA